MKIGQYVGWAWDMFKSDYFTFFIITVFGSLFTLLSFGLLTGPVMCGYMNVVFKKYRGQSVEIHDFLRGFDHLGERIIAGVIFLVAVLIGTFFFFVPGLIVAGMLILVFPLMADREMVASEAMRNTIELWREDKFGFSTLAAVSILLCISGCMICFFGIFIFVPVAYATIAAAYIDIVGLEITSHEQNSI